MAGQGPMRCRSAGSLLSRAREDGVSRAASQPAAGHPRAALLSGARR